MAQWLSTLPMHDFSATAHAAAGLGTKVGLGAWDHGDRGGWCRPSQELSQALVHTCH